MFTSPTCDFALLERETAIGRVRTAIDERAPFSLVRLGDGEAIVLSADDNMWLQDLAYLHGHWGAARVSLRDVVQVRDDLRSAVCNADIVGVRDDIIGVTTPDDLLDRSGAEVLGFVRQSFHLRPGEVDNLSEIGARRIALLHDALGKTEWADDQEFCSAWIHWDLLESGALDAILEGVDEVGLVTARPELELMVSKRFDVKTSVVQVPDKHVEHPRPGAHVPDRYQTVRSDFDFPAGSLVLVGAGIPGKVYCDWLKQAGCVAIDIGAVLDMWVGKASRPRVLQTRFAVSGGDRVPSKFQLHAEESVRDSALVPRWKPSRLVP